MTLHEQRIIWPGSETQKPKGIKISTHLQVLPQIWRDSVDIVRYVNLFTYFLIDLVSRYLTIDSLRSINLDRQITIFVINLLGLKFCYLEFRRLQKEFFNKADILNVSY